MRGPVHIVPVGVVLYWPHGDCSCRIPSLNLRHHYHTSRRAAPFTTSTYSYSGAFLTQQNDLEERQSSHEITLRVHGRAGMSSLDTDEGRVFKLFIASATHTLASPIPLMLRLQRYYESRRSDASVGFLVVTPWSSTGCPIACSHVSSASCTLQGTMLHLQVSQEFIRADARNVPSASAGAHSTLESAGGERSQCALASGVGTCGSSYAVAQPKLDIKLTYPARISPYPCPA